MLRGLGSRRVSEGSNWIREMLELHACIASELGRFTGSYLGVLDGMVSDGWYDIHDGVARSLLLVLARTWTTYAVPWSGCEFASHFAARKIHDNRESGHCYGNLGDSRVDEPAWLTLRYDYNIRYLFKLRTWWSFRLFILFLSCLPPVEECLASGLSHTYCSSAGPY